MAAAILELRQLSKRFGDTVPADDISLAIAKGEFFTLLGPSGSGKSTILRIIAGLEQADGGEVLLDGREVSDVSPWDRRLGMVFQQYANFPHMNVAENVGYGLRRSGLAKMQIEARVTELLELVGLQGFQRRRVTQLSGGEQQRVAIARALAPKPALLLLDEPLSIAVLNRGRCVQCDAPERIFRRPRTRFVAGFFRGCNVLEAEVEWDGEGCVASLCGATIRLPSQFGAGAKAVAIRGEVILLGTIAEEADLILDARLETVTYRGVYSDYRIRLADGQVLSATLPHRHDLAAGTALRVGIRTADVVLLEND
jgi:ABC-type Fe3+/spermidine/putrescine transport system ATPase subunit